MAGELRDLTQFGEALFDFAVEREAAGVSLGEDLPAVDDHVELTDTPRFDLDGFREAGFKRDRQTGGSGPIASGDAIKNFRRHAFKSRRPRAAPQSA